MTRIIARCLLVALLCVTLLPAAAAFAQQRQAGWLALETARDYTKAARYPDWSRALEAGAKDPIREKRVPTKITARDPEGEGPALTVWSKKVSFEYPGPVHLYASVEGNAPAVITGEVVSATGELVGTVRFFDDGADPDEMAGDGVYTARHGFAKSYRPELAENFLVRVQATFENGESRFATGGFLYSRPYAQLTGRYRDKVRDGSLVISARVRVSEAGRFHVAATLHTLGGEPIGTAQTAVTLEPGRHWIDLEFYGLMFHDRQAAGPYRLGSVALSTTHGMPNALNDLATDAYVTRSVSAKRFTAKPFGHAGLLEAARRLEAEARRSGARLEE